MRTVTIILFGAWLFTGWAWFEETKQTKKYQLMLDAKELKYNILQCEMDSCTNYNKKYSEIFMKLYNGMKK